MRTLAARFLSANGAAILLATSGLLLVYTGHIATGLYYDDYHFVRPWPWLDLRRVWFGSWDPTGIESVFYRPLTAWLFAARFWLFGINTTAMHVVSVLGHGLCALLLGWFLRREHAPRPIAALGVWTYAVYPVFPHAQVSWLTNQMHLAESMVVITALIWWQGLRAAPPLRWLTLACLTVIAFLIKEDGAMLPSVLLALTIAHSLADGRANVRRLTAIGVGAVVLTVGLAAFRYERLQALGGYGVPSLGGGYANLLKGIEGALFLWPTRRPWQAVSSCIAIASIVTALTLARQRSAHWRLVAASLATIGVLGLNVATLLLPRPYPLVTVQGVASGLAMSVLIVGLGSAVWRRDRSSIYLLAVGTLIVLGFNAPFVLVSKREQFHLLGLGAVVAFTGGSSALLSSVRPSWRVAAVAVLFLTSSSYGLLSRQLAGDFCPCNPSVLAADQEAHSWWIVPDEVRGWLGTKAQTCTEHHEAPALVNTAAIVWGTHNVQDEHNGMTRWVSDYSVVLLRGGTRTITVGFRRLDAAPSHPVSIEMKSSGMPAFLTLNSADWQFVTIKLRPTLLSWVRCGERVDIGVNDWFVPAVLEPSSQDLRRLGAEFRIVDLPSLAAPQ